MKTTLQFFAFAFASLAHAQSLFQNLDFEQTTLPYLSNQVGSFVATSDAFPGWTVYRGGVAQAQVPYNGLTGQTEIDLWTRDFHNVIPRPVSFGRFSPLYGIGSDSLSSLALGQIGTIPNDAGLLTFATFVNADAGGLQLKFGDTTLSLQMLTTTNGTDIWGADVSAFAGQTGELRITAVPTFEHGGFFLDQIQFVSIPEPGTWALLGSGAAVFCWLRRRKNDS